jgi:threonyl-tRNA synthetase
VLPISEKYNDYAQKVSEYLNNSDIRTVVDERNEKIGRKIRDNEMKRIPYLLVVGEKEFETETVAVRRQGEGDQGTVSLIEFKEKIQKEVSSILEELYK